MQAAVKAAVGEEATVFEQISDGSRSFRKGEIVRVKHKNKGAATVGLIQHFYVQKASHLSPVFKALNVRDMRLGRKMQHCIQAMKLMLSRCLWDGPCS